MALDPDWVDQTLGITDEVDHFDDVEPDDVEPPEDFGAVEPDNSAAARIRTVLAGVSRRDSAAQRQAAATQVNTALLNMAEDITAEHQRAVQENWVGDPMRQLAAERTYTQQREDFASVVDAARGTVPLDERVTDYVVAFDHDHTMSRVLGVDVPAHYGRNKHHGGVRGKPVSATRTIQPDFHAAVTQPVAGRRDSVQRQQQRQVDRQGQPEGVPSVEDVKPTPKRHPAVAKVLGERTEQRQSQQTPDGPEL